MRDKNHSGLSETAINRVQGGIRLFKVFGINIFVDPSWLFIFLLLTWNLASGIFPNIHPEWSIALNVVVSIAASLIFFASVLAHELAHSVMAQKRGMKVNRIILFLFGGIADIEKEPPTPMTEILMAIVGPITSIGLAGVFFTMLQLTQIGITNIMQEGAEALSALGPLLTMLIWLGSVNLAVGFFNLLPGFPLDGGRVLRSILWRLTDNLEKATLWASKVGAGFGYLFILSGIVMLFGFSVPLLGGGIINGLWIIFIGWFLKNAAGQSYRRLVVFKELEEARVEDIINKEVPTVSMSLNLDEFVDRYLLSTPFTSFPVIKNNEVVGVVGVKQVKDLNREERQDMVVADVMKPISDAIVVSPQSSLRDVFVKISKSKGIIALVLDKDTYRGIVKKKDIAKWLKLKGDVVSVLFLHTSNWKLIQHKHRCA